MSSNMNYSMLGKNSGGSSSYGSATNGFTENYVENAGNGGFSFCDVDCSTFGLYYAPDLKNTFVYKNADANLYEEQIPARYGGVYYGTNPKPKEFELRCYFEQGHLNHGIIDSILNFYYIGRTGRLVFDTRDWLWYSATVINVDVSPTNYMNGFITIRFRAYYPYARTDLRCIYDEENFAIFDFYDFNCDSDGHPILDEDVDETDSYLTFVPSDELFDLDDEEDSNEHILSPVIREHDATTSYLGNIEDPDFTVLSNQEFFIDVDGELTFTEDSTIYNKALFLKDNQIPEMSFENVKSSKSLLLYNAGNAPAALSVGFKGEAGDVGLIIRNKTNGGEMKFIGFDRSTIGDGYIYTDSLNGKTTLVDSNGSHQLKFIYHDHGYIHLDPASPVLINAKFKAVKNSAMIRMNTRTSAAFIGKYIFISGQWYKIKSIFDNMTIVVDRNVEETGIYSSHIMTMNEIEIEIAEDGTEIDHIFFNYRHTFR